VSLPVTADRFMNPAVLAPKAKDDTAQKDESGESAQGTLELLVADLSRQIENSPNQARLYLERGKNYLELQQFDNAIEDLTKALSLNDALDAAYFGRGMAYGRKKELKRGMI